MKRKLENISAEDEQKGSMNACYVINMKELDCLPAELLHDVIGFLNYKDLFQLGTTSRKYREISADALMFDDVWKNRMLSDKCQKIPHAISFINACDVG